MSRPNKIITNNRGRKNEKVFKYSFGPYACICSCIL